jgi:3-oxoacyl-[acyl-carrier-protein] synthase-3
MALLTVPHVAVRGMSSCVPPFTEATRDIEFYATTEEAIKIEETTGVIRKHIVKDSGITGADLCIRAAERLFDDIGWERDSIDLIVNVTQTSDYINHPNVFVAHERLGLKKDCMSLDIYHGCPGWVIGLLSAASLLSHGQMRRCLLLDGDNISSMQWGLDHESRPLFGDCGTATLLEFDKDTCPLYFDTGTNSEEGKALIHEQGGYRNPFTLESLRDELDMRSGKLTPVENGMDGMSVFSFGISAPPKSIKRLCEAFDINLADIDKFVLHQANLFMVQKIAKKLKIEAERVPISLGEYGNVTSASIPLTIISQCAEEYRTKTVKTLACGFGTGLSWASVYMETTDLIIPNVIVY